MKTKPQQKFISLTVALIVSACAVSCGVPKSYSDATEASSVTEAYTANMQRSSYEYVEYETNTEEVAGDFILNDSYIIANAINEGGISKNDSTIFKRKLILMETYKNFSF